MPPAVGKSKPKGKDGRHSRSRNTTPSSSVSAPLTSSTPSFTAFLDIALSSLMVPTNISYDSVLDRHGGGGGIPDPTHLETISGDLKTLAQLAEARSNANNKGMRDLSERRKHFIEEERELEREQANLDAEEARRNVKREEEDERERTGRAKKKERSRVREERPLAIGAHGVARQDGLDLPLEGTWRVCLYRWSHACLTHRICIIRILILFLTHSSCISFCMQIWQVKKEEQKDHGLPSLRENLTTRIKSFTTIPGTTLFLADTTPKKPITLCEAYLGAIIIGKCLMFT